MALYRIENDTCLGISHSGPVNVESEGFIELSDEEVVKIVDLIRKEGTTDIDELGLEETYPDIYQKLDKAYHDMAYDAEEAHWLREGYTIDAFEYDAEELMAYCEENCGFEYEFGEEDFLENGELSEDALDCKLFDFYTWLDDYVESLKGEEMKDFFYNHLNAEMEELDEVDYEVAIPEAIIKMAEKRK